MSGGCRTKSATKQQQHDNMGHKIICQRLVQFHFGHRVKNYLINCFFSVIKYGTRTAYTFDVCLYVRTRSDEIRGKKGERTMLWVGHSGALGRRPRPPEARRTKNNGRYAEMTCTRERINRWPSPTGHVVPSERLDDRDYFAFAACCLCYDCCCCTWFLKLCGDDEVFFFYLPQTS